MENLQKSLETLRTENRDRKLQIIKCLEDLIKPKTTLPHNDSTSSSANIISLFEYEKKVHDKLIEIQLDLHKFLVFNETPPINAENLLFPNANINILISNTSKLLAQLENISIPNSSQSTNNNVNLDKSSTNLHDKSEQAWRKLPDSPVTPTVNLEEKLLEKAEIQSSKDTTNICGHFQEIHDNFPQIYEECNSKSDNTEPTSSNNKCQHFPKLSPKWPELDKICPDTKQNPKNSYETMEELDKEQQKNMMGVHFSRSCPEKLNNNLFGVDESVSSETESSLFEIEMPLNIDFEQKTEKNTNTKLNNNGASETKGSDNERKEILGDSGEISVYKKIFGVPTSVLKEEHSKNICRVQNNLADGFSMLDIEDEKGLSEENSQSMIKDCNIKANPFSAEQKILKLGTMDRREAFEKSRPIAPIPDLRLLPSKSTKGASPSIQYVIKDAKIPRLYENCVVSHVESPSEFYLHIVSEENDILDLNEKITSQYKGTMKLFRTKQEAFDSLGNFCCAYVKTKQTFCRVEVNNWFFDQRDSLLVLVQLVDYGNKVLVHFKNMRPLTEEFATLPKMAVKCYLPMLYPPGSSIASLLDVWPPASINEYTELTGSNQPERNKPIYKIIYLQEAGEKTAVDLYKDGTTIGQILLDLGHAVQIILPEDDPMGIILEDEEIQRLEECNNINEVILGYDPKDEGRICKFTREDGTCYKGKNCSLEHIQLPKGGFTNDKILTFVGAFNRMILPKEGDEVQIKFTVFIDAAHYYVNFSRYADALVDLENIINDKTNISSLKTYKIVPAFGEIVLARHWSNKWLRAKIKHHSYNDEGYCIGVQIFMVDYGDIIDVPLSHIRHIKAEYLQVPFQAIECVFYNYKMSNMKNVRDADKFFYENMVYRDFIARIMAVSDTLCIQVFYKNQNLGQILQERGFLIEIDRNFPSNKAVAIPSG